MGWQYYADEYAVFLKHTYLIIKDECPECKVVIGGFSGVSTGFNNTFYTAKFLDTLLMNGSGNYFDIFEFKQHYHNAKNYREIGNKLQVYAQIFSNHGLNIQNYPIFIETATHNGNPYLQPPPPPLVYQSETVQAWGLLKTYIYSISIGIDKIFWNLVIERYNFGGQSSNAFNHYGIVNNPQNDGDSSKKLSYFAYKKMIEILDGSDWANTVTVQEDTVNNVFVYKFIKNGNPIYVAWWDYFNTTGYNQGDSIAVTINGLSSITKVSVTQAVPKDTSGISITNYNTAFKSDTVNVQGNSATFYIKEKPVFVEKLNVTSINETKDDIVVKVYPNPFNTTVTLQLPVSGLDLKIFDEIGKVVFEKTLNFKQETLNLNLPGGIYFYQVKDNKQFISTGKIIIQ